jgi:hypothetical protein
MLMLRIKQRNLTMDQRRIWGTDGSLQNSVKIRQYISDIYNMIMAKQMQQQVLYPQWRLYCNKWQHLKAKHIWGECSIQYVAIV